MFKKILTTISVAAILTTSLSAANFCKDGADRFLNNKLFALYKNYNIPFKNTYTSLKAGGAESYGTYKGLEQVADIIFKRAGIGDGYVSLLTKEGVKANINKTQIYINYLEFFEDYLYNKLQNMSPNDRRLFLEKFYFFNSRPPTYIVNLGINNMAKEFMFQKMFFNNFSDKEINDYEKSMLGAGGNLLWTLRQLQKPLMNNSKDPQLGGAANNIHKFFVYVVTKKFDKAYNLIDKTYPDNFVKSFNEKIKEFCKIK